MAAVIDWIRKHPLGSASGGVLALLAVLIALAGLLSGDPTGDTLAFDTTPPASPAPVLPTEAQGSGELAGVEAIDCTGLLTFEEVEEALGVSGEDSPFQMTQEEACVNALIDRDDVFVVVRPGSPDDFTPGALQIGVTGEPVSGVGETALWFGGELAEGGGTVGLLAVRQPTSLGVLHFQIVLGRPDATDRHAHRSSAGLDGAGNPGRPGRAQRRPVQRQRRAG